MPASRTEEARRRQLGLEQEGSIHQTITLQAFGGRIWVLGFGVWSGGAGRTSRGAKSPSTGVQDHDSAKKRLEIYLRDKLLEQSTVNF